jgi:hypothetical protein
MSAPLLLPVDTWQIDATSRLVALRISAERSSDFSVAAHEHGFLLEPEQARQIIRDLSAAVLASDVRRCAEGTNDELQSRLEPPDV